MQRFSPFPSLTAVQGNSYDCCHRFYGSPEYPKAIEPDDSAYRVVDKYLFAGADEILSNTAIVDKDGIAVSTAHSRFADDEIVIDDNCTASGVPEGLSCVGFRQKMQRSTSIARCTDNNQTVKTLRLPRSSGYKEGQQECS